MRNEQDFHEPDEFDRSDDPQWDDLEDGSDSWMDGADADEVSDCEAAWIGDVDDDFLADDLDDEYIETDGLSDKSDDDWDEEESDAAQELNRRWNPYRDDC